jgi:hypothetical protein
MPIEHEDHPLMQDAAILAAAREDDSKREDEKRTARKNWEETFVAAQKKELEFLDETGTVDEFRIAAEIMNGSDIGPRGDVVLTVSTPQAPQDGDLTPPHMDVILTWQGITREQDSGFMDEGKPHTHFEDRWNRLRAVVGGREGAYTLTIGGITVKDPTDRDATRTEIVANVRNPLKSDWHGVNSKVYLAERRGVGRRKIDLPRTG